MIDNLNIVVSELIDINNRDLVALYKLETKMFNQAIKRNLNRFSQSFIFQLNEKEIKNLKSQFTTSSSNKYGDRRYMSYVFTKEWIDMLSTVLKSDIAIEVSIKIINSFVKIREFLLSNKDIFIRLDKVELKKLEIDKKLKDIDKFNDQYPKLNLKIKTDFNDRFLILDKTEVYHKSLLNKIK